MFTLRGRQLTQKIRVRTITRWSIYDWGDGEYSVAGWIVTGNEPGDGQATRHTRTSPIGCRVGNNVLITRSGSRYTLLEPAEDQDPDQILELFKDQQKVNTKECP